MLDDSADELLQRVLNGDQTALELWSQTRAWVISGQRKTLARLGIHFDRVFFESDFLPEVAELTELGLQEGTLEKRVDGTVIYMTGREELEEMPLVRSDGVPTQHMRALAYWLADTGLDGTTSVQVCGQEWFAHVTCRRQLMAELVHTESGNGFHPYHDIFHGMVAREREKIASSKKDALLIDHLVEWIDEQIEADPRREAVRRGHPSPDKVASQVALGYFLLHTATKRVDFEPEKLLADDKALGWDLARARSSRRQRRAPATRSPSSTPTTASRSSRRRPTGACWAGWRRASRSRRWPATPRTWPAGSWKRSGRRTYGGSSTRRSTGRPAASVWRRRHEDAARRQPRLLHLQRLPPARRGQRRGADRGRQRRRLLAGALALGLRRDRPLPRSRQPAALARLLRLQRHPPLQRDPGARHLPRPPGARPDARRQGQQRAGGDARPAQPHPPSEDDGLFAGIPQDFPVVRYHSLAITDMGPDGNVTAWADDGVVMGIEHRRRPMWGVQFHPESIATEHGARLVENFYDLARRQRSPRWRGAKRPLQAPRRSTARRVRSGGGESELRLRSIPGEPSTEALFERLFGDAEHAFWLDSADAPTRLAQRSFLGTSAGAGRCVLEYDVESGTAIRQRRRRREHASAPRSSTCSTASSRGMRSSHPPPTCRPD